MAVRWMDLEPGTGAGCKVQAEIWGHGHGPIRFIGWLHRVVVDGVAGSGPATASCINIKTLAGDMQMLRSQHHPYLSPSLLVPAVARLSVILARSFSSALSLLRSPTAVHALSRHPVPQLARQPAPPLGFHCHSLSAPRHACVIGRIWRPN
jgi:hypothetical protein